MRLWAAAGAIALGGGSAMSVNLLVLNHDYSRLGQISANDPFVRSSTTTSIAPVSPSLTNAPANAASTVEQPPATVAPTTFEGTVEPVITSTTPPTVAPPKPGKPRVTRTTTSTVATTTSLDRGSNSDGDKADRGGHGDHGGPDTTTTRPKDD